MCIESLWKAGADEERKRQEEEKRQLAVECFEATRVVFTLKSRCISHI